MSTFIGGKLKLKGGDSGKPGGVQKKKKKQQISQALELAAGSDESAQLQHTGSSPPAKQGLEGHAIKPPSEDSDRRTEAERKHDDRTRQREEDRLKSQAHKSHRDRVKDFNEYLTALSEHHDIPKVGPG
ncbi:MAG: hypothetical protein WDW38_009884 [Sanguina aurantia]